MSIVPLAYACKTCNTRFPHRYGYRRRSALSFRGTFDDTPTVADKLLVIATIPLGLAFAAVWVPMEAMFPPCPMCGHGVIRRAL